MTTPRTTESFGVGQSGYAAGRHGHDPSLENQILVRNIAYPYREVENHGMGLDERFVGRGGPIWDPPDPKNT
jgi:hypothetical protein